MAKTRAVRSWRNVLATLVVGVVAPLAAAAPASASDPAPAAVPTAYLYAPTAGGRAVVRWNGQAAGFTLPKATAMLPGSFDGHGGGVFFYRAGRGYDGVLRVRVVDGKLTVSFRPERVDGTYRPVTGDFDGNGVTDILWEPDGWHGTASYVWLFRPDGSHTSHKFGGTADPRSIETATPMDVNVDGVTDLLSPWEGGLWIMGPNLTSTHQTLTPVEATGVWGFATGNIGPDDGHLRRRMVVVFEGWRRRLVTFNAQGQYTWKELSPQIGNCCAYQNAFVGHFHAGYTKTLFTYGSHQPELPEYFEDITAGGNLVRVKGPQLDRPYDIAVGDFDGNGYDDLLLHNSGSTVRLLSSDGANMTLSTPPAIPPASRLYAVQVVPGATA